MPAEEVVYPPEVQDLLVEFETLIQKISENISQQAVEPAVRAAREQWEKLESLNTALNEDRLESKRLLNQVVDDFREGTLKVTRTQKRIFDEVAEGFEAKQSAVVNNLGATAKDLQQTCDEVTENLNEYYDDHISQIEEIRKGLQDALSSIAEKHESLAERYDSLANDRRQELKKTLGFLEEVRISSIKSRITFWICFSLLFLFQAAIIGMFMYGAGLIKI